MNSRVSTNKQGQALGPKGYATRERLLHAAERLLQKHSSLDPKIVHNGIGMERLVAAQARIIAQVLADTPGWGLLPLGKKPRTNAG